MNEFERELEKSLRRVAAPEGFADRVMQRVARRERRVFLLASVREAPVHLRAVAAVVLAGSLFAVGAVEKRHHDRVEAIEAQQQLDLAMQVTGRTISGVQARINRLGLRIEEVAQ